jgi:hypothetical protein
MEKIARICWNTHDWKRPSGSEGKSQYGIPMKTKLDLAMRSGFWMTHVFMSQTAITMHFCNR